MYEFVPWSEFLPRFRWRQGEHVVVIGRTGNGKTTLISRIVGKRKHVAVMVTKLYDPTFRREFPSHQWDIQRAWKPSGLTPRVLLWPDHKGDLRESKEAQRGVFRDALNKIYRDRGWCVVMDEAHWMTTELGLGPELAMYQHQARSSGISVVTGVQRPSHIPVITYGAASHAFIGRQNEPGDLKRLANLGGVNAKELAAAVLALPKHEWIYVDNVSNTPPIRTRVEL